MDPSAGNVVRTARQLPEPKCGSCSSQLQAPKTCLRCGRGNLVEHSYCGFCGLKLPPLRPRQLDSIDEEYSEEITLRHKVPESSRPILVASHGQSVRTQDFGPDPLQTKEFGPPPDITADFGSQPLPTRPEINPPIPFADEMFAPTEPDSPVDTINQALTQQGEKLKGMCVVLFAGAHSTKALDVFPLEFNEPLDIDGKRFIEKGTFTAVRTGLRLDRLGSIGTVYACLDGRIPLMPGRARRYERTMGTFQAIRPGEILPLRSFAFVDHALIRIDAL